MFLFCQCPYIACLNFRFWLLAGLAALALVMLLCFATPRTTERTMSASCLTSFTLKLSIASYGFDCARWFFFGSRTVVRSPFSLSLFHAPVQGFTQRPIIFPSPVQGVYLVTLPPRLCCPFPPLLLLHV